MKDNMNMNAGGVKDDAAKIRMDLFPPEVAMAISAVFTHGAEKYDDWNWAKGMRAGRLVASIERHLADWKAGIEFDESGYPTLWHLGCAVTMLIGCDLRDVLEDDRQFTDEVTGAVDYVKAMHDLVRVDRSVEGQTHGAPADFGEPSEAPDPSGYRPSSEQGANIADPWDRFVYLESQDAVLRLGSVVRVADNFRPDLSMADGLMIVVGIQPDHEDPSNPKVVMAMVQRNDCGDRVAAMPEFGGRNVWSNRLSFWDEHVIAVEEPAVTHGPVMVYHDAWGGEDFLKSEKHCPRG